VTIGFKYDPLELVRLGIRESMLKPAYFSTTTDRWTLPESYAVDGERNLVTMQIDHFTDFSLTAMDVWTAFLPVASR
jgi:hypothetical protein